MEQRKYNEGILEFLGDHASPQNCLTIFHFDTEIFHILKLAGSTNNHIMMMLRTFRLRNARLKHVGSPFVCVLGMLDNYC